MDFITIKLKGISVGGTVMLKRQFAEDIFNIQATVNKELTHERWQAILQCNHIFLQHDADDLCKYPYMDHEVAASWIRSRNMGVNPYTVVTSPHLNSKEIAEVLDKHRALIDITNTLVKPFNDLILSCGYILYLFSKNGIILLNKGKWQESPLLSERESRLGIVADETSEGTTAHELCIRLKRPVLLLGPEHYCIAFQNRIASAAPIKNASGEVQAALVLLSPLLLKLPDEESLKHMSLTNLGWVTTMAVAIETQLMLQWTNCDFYNTGPNGNLENANSKLVTITNTINTILNCSDGAIIAIDRTGKIIHSSQEGMRILKLKPEEFGRRNICEFLSSDSQLMSLAEKGETTTVEECICRGSDKRFYQVSIRPVLDPASGQLDIAVIKLSFSEKVIQVSNKSANISRFTFDDIISNDKDFMKVIALAQRFAGTLENILLIGESGTGKELFAQAIHDISRPQGPFVAVNCASMPRELIASELFGYEGGSFTGAERSGKIGKIELANGGTLFLDEIGDMPLDFQAVLLRILEDKMIMHIGGQRYKKIDFRLITATNKDIYKLGRENEFREDLYYRLSTLTITIPPLRERGNDAILISQTIVKDYCQKMGINIPQVSSATKKIISQYGWPGNVRQLKNAMIYAVNTAQDGMIKPENLPTHIVMEIFPQKSNEIVHSTEKINKMLSLENLEKNAIETALLYVNNVVPAAAEILGISRSTLYRKLKDYNIQY